LPVRSKLVGGFSNGTSVDKLKSGWNKRAHRR